MKKERLILTVSGVLAGLLIGMVLPIGEVPENAIFNPRAGNGNVLHRNLYRAC